MRYDLTDFEWSVIEPVLPKGRPGPKRKNDPFPDPATAAKAFIAVGRGLPPRVRELLSQSLAV
jgi:transposase